MTGEGERSLAGVLGVLGAVSALLLSLGACEAQGPVPGLEVGASASNQATTQAPHSSPWAPSGGLFWVDETEAMVDGMAVLPEGLAMERDGAWWLVSPAEHDRATVFRAMFELWATRYEDPSCLDPVIQVSSHMLPGHTVMDEHGQTWLMRTQSPTFLLDALYELTEEGDCISVGDGPHTARPTEAFAPVFRPEVDWTPPLHPKYVR